MERRKGGAMAGQPDASAAGTIDVGGDLTVNRMGFGAMRITGQGIWGPPPNREQAQAVLRRTVELGVNFIDTADSYGPEVSEALIADTLYPYPGDLVIATKGGLVRPGPGRWQPAPAQAGPDSAVSAAPAGSEGALCRVRRRAGRAQERGQDPPHRDLQRDREPAARGPAAHAGGVGAKPLQPRGQVVGADRRPV